MNFSQALESLKEGQKLYREGWNGKGLFIQAQYPDSNSKMTQPYIYMTCPLGSTKHYITDKIERIPWIPCQGDLFAEDWYVKEEE